ncbi:DUF2914 domain-containing protein [Candidatus Thiothrix sp. Deng01]|uniref:DUF2914 domain-containing protein n=1 Tax=Candidatus Thiothrix phosphatis TaxID=3112415 RepID=A0ABU6CVQ2_9GAMM|nr:DUF2914 domain-containing protein [Candidatus Thiothrix sp. Deng01]MEB4590612.1 DUF2914 domain-containing protein [Candidatus Thiothrix sp. Deng01]
MHNACLKMATFLLILGPIWQTVQAEDATTTPAIPQETTQAAPQVSRSAFTTGINAHEPIDQLTRISAGQEIYYFTELANLQGHVVTHRWERDGALQLGLQFPVGAQRWRVHSNKNIGANLPGTWTVTVLNDDGSILKQDTLLVDPASPAGQVSSPIVPPPHPTAAVVTEKPAQPVEPEPAKKDLEPSSSTASPSAKEAPEPSSSAESPSAKEAPEPSSSAESSPEKETAETSPTVTAPEHKTQPIWETLR